MKRFLKTVAALLLTSVMIVSLFPSMAFADDEEVTTVAETIVEVEDTTNVNNNVLTDGTTVEDAVEENDETEVPEEPEVPVEPEAPAEPEYVALNAIISQPEDAIVAPGKTAVFSVGVDGTVKKYQWQYSTNGRTWKDLSTKAELSVKASNSFFGNNRYKYRCIVTFDDNTKDTSDAATLYVASRQSFKSAKNNKSMDTKVSADAPEGTFPTGTTMDVADVDAAEYVDAINEVLDDVSAADVTAVDISFNYNGEEIEPANGNKVTVTLKADAVKEGARLVHIDDFGVATEIAEEDIVSIKDGEIVFKSDAFSVYVVVGGDDPVARITYNFVDGEGNPYPFLNKAGQTVTSQIIKDGESLQEVPAPGLLHNQAFVMWVYDGGDLDGQEVTFGQAITVTENKEYTIKAYYGSVIYVNFWQYAAGKVILERKQIAKNSDGKYICNMSDVTVPAPKTTLKFMGWSLTPGTDASEEGGDTPGARTLLPNSNYEFTQDTDVYPVYYNGLWIVFVSAGTGMGASYVESYFLSADSATAVAAKPTDPTMTGYAFDDWYTVPDPDYTAADNVTTGKFDFNTAFADLSQYTNDRGEVVLYGHWKGGSTTYVVVYWKQQVGNSKTATDAQKTYDYAGQTNPISDTTGATPAPTTAQQRADTGFEYKRYELVDVDDEGNVTPSTGLKADGSTVLNVYFDRKTITMRFYKTAGTSGYSSFTAPQQYNSNRWGNASYTDIYTGLYGQTWSQAGYNHDWPSPGNGYYWVYFNSGYTNENSTTVNMTNYSQQGTIMTYLGQFILPDNVHDSNGVDIRLFKISAQTSTVSYYLQNVNGSYPTSTNITGAAPSSGTFGFSDKYEGFKVVQYRLGSGNWQNVSSTTNSDGTHNYTPASISVSGNLSIRYERIPYEIKFLNPLNENPVLDSKTLLYGASLSSAKPSSTTQVDLGVAGYEWDGKWYKDKACTVEFDFNAETMPLDGIKVYAGKTPIYFYIKIDPNGGQLQTGQATWRWVIYGDDSTYTYDNIERNYIDYKGSGDAYYYYYDEFDTSRRDDIWNYTYMSINPRTAYYTKNTVPDDWDQVISGSTIHHNGSEAQAWLNTTKKYSYEADAYALIGWYDITDGVANMKPFKTGTAVTRDTIIQAQWRRTGEYSVVYSVDAVDENGNALNWPEGSESAGQRVQGANSPVDSAKYADMSDSAMLDKMGVIPAGYEFIGWWYGGKMYEPGDVFQVKSSLTLEDTKTVFIYPVLKPVESIPVEVINITFDANGGVFTDEIEDDLQDIIDAVKAKDDSTGTDKYNPTYVENTDGTYTINNLKLNESFDILPASAVANGVIVGEGEDAERILGRGYRLKEWNTKKDGSGTSFKLDYEAGIDDVEPVPNVLYAIWEPLFYIYHSSTDKFETVVIDSKATIDRWTKTNTYDNGYVDYYYGGYNVIADGSTKQPSNITFSSGDASGTMAADYWTRSAAAKDATGWDSGDIGSIYYIKEVPTWYLPAPKAAVVKDNYGNGNITSIHFLTVTDTNIYRQGGVVVGSEIKGSFAKTFTITENNGSKTKYTPEELFENSKLTGYFSVVNFGTLDTTTYTSCKGYWVTYDGIKVYGIDANIRDITIN